MDESGVEKAVILGQDTHATRNPSFKNYTIRNDDLAEVAAEGKGRLLPFAGVDPNAPPQALKELQRAIRELGGRGLKVHNSANSVYLNDRTNMDPLYALY